MARPCRRGGHPPPPVLYSLAPFPSANPSSSLPFPLAPHVLSLSHTHTLAKLTTTHRSTPLRITAATGHRPPHRRVQEDRHHRLRPSRASNRAGPPCTLAIDLVSTAYIVVVRRRLPPPRSVPDLPEHAYGSAVSFSTGSSLSLPRSVAVEAALTLGRHEWELELLCVRACDAACFCCAATCCSCSHRCSSLLPLVSAAPASPAAPSLPRGHAQAHPSARCCSRLPALPPPPLAVTAAAALLQAPAAALLFCWQARCPACSCYRFLLLVATTD